MRSDMLRNVWLAASQKQKGRALNPRKRKAANAATNEETRTSPQGQNKEPQGKDDDPPRAHYLIGLDLSDRTTHYAVLGPAGEEWRAEKKIQLNRESLRRHLAKYTGSLLVMEVGAHSRWIQLGIEERGPDVFVAHAASIPGITRSVNQHDRADARQLVRLGRADCGLLRRTHHRSNVTQCDLLLIRSRAALVKSHSSLIVCARGLLKSFGERVSGESESFADLALDSIPPHLRSALSGLLEAIHSLTDL